MIRTKLSLDFLPLSRQVPIPDGVKSVLPTMTSKVRLHAFTRSARVF
jgi:hypothetical protein